MYKILKHCKIKNSNIVNKRNVETGKNIVVPTKNIRNIGIIAHIDAGKTTCTERLLYLTGTTSSVGDVDDGNTVTDFMELERERGITIQSAAVTSFWKDHRINLIDTPGHVDFTLEVERCLRVLDGAVTVLDASAGVQAQTLTVWKQANKFRLPCVFFINKMDKIGADHIKSMESIENKLGQRVCALIVPTFTDSKLTGLVNLLERKSLDLTNPKATWISISQNERFSDELLGGREELFSRIGDVNDGFANSLLSTKDLFNFPVDTAIAALRKT
uniref:Tr-type G domain-containing protein n=1 Tax=Panagrolaimus sp. ES5 TaxID=591445 RepID=A0AC34FHL3_9BILA